MRSSVSVLCLMRVIYSFKYMRRCRKGRNVSGGTFCLLLLLHATSVCVMSVCLSSVFLSGIYMFVSLSVCLSVYGCVSVEKFKFKFCGIRGNRIEIERIESCLSMDVKNSQLFWDSGKETQNLLFDSDIR